MASAFATRISMCVAWGQYIAINDVAMVFVKKHYSVYSCGNAVHNIHLNALYMHKNSSMHSLHT